MYLFYNSDKHFFLGGVGKCPNPLPLDVALLRSKINTKKEGIKQMTLFSWLRQSIPGSNLKLHFKKVEL